MSRCSLGRSCALWATARWGLPCGVLGFRDNGDRAYENVGFGACMFLGTKTPAS